MSYNTVAPQSMSDAHGVSLDEYQSITSSPLTPGERTKIVTDILLHLQEEYHTRGDEIPDDTWNGTVETVSGLGDDELLHRWSGGTGEWIASRTDIPADEHPVVQYLERNLEGEHRVPYQLFKRLVDDTTPDYGFLGWTVYKHDTDTDES